MKQSDPIKSHITALIEKYERRIESIKNTFFVNTYEAGRADGAMSELEEVIEDLRCVRDAVDA
jgi:hypothetical protein